MKAHIALYELTLIRYEYYLVISQVKMLSYSLSDDVIHLPVALCQCQIVIQQVLISLNELEDVKSNVGMDGATLLQIQCDNRLCKFSDIHSSIVFSFVDLLFEAFLP